MTFSTSVLWAQATIPSGTILPVRLNCPLKSSHNRAGEIISARIMQKVPIPGNRDIPEGAKIVGHIVSVEPASDSQGGTVSFRFDSVIMGKQKIPISTDLRALASMMDILEAQVPDSGPDRGSPENFWVTHQIGGDVDYHGGQVTQGSFTVGQSVTNGVLVRLTSHAGSKCRGQADDNPQALWVFSSDACGLYSYSQLVIAHAGRTEPVGEITIRSQQGNFDIRSGSGMLLRVESSPQ